MDRQRLPLALRILALSPAVLAAFMYVLTPTYFRPMLVSVVGLITLAILATFICVGYGLVEAGIWLLRKGRVVLGVLVLVVYSMTWLVAIVIITLGPAALIVIKPTA